MLHAIFEELYCFDLEDKRKKNLGPTVKWLEKMDGTSRFVVAYVVQAALGGHSIPVDAGTMAVFRLLGTGRARRKRPPGEVPGMERAIAKSKGIEFGSLIHQLGADYLGQSLFAAGPRDPAGDRSRGRAAVPAAAPAASRARRRRRPKQPQRAAGRKKKSDRRRQPSRPEAERQACQARR